MLELSRLSPKAQAALGVQGAKKGETMRAPELSRVLQKGIDADHNDMVSESEAKAAGFTPQDRDLINKALRSGPALPGLSLTQEDVKKVAFPDKPWTPKIDDSPAAPKTIFTPPGKPAEKAPTAPPKYTLGDDTVNFDTKPVLKPNQDPTSQQLETLEAVNFEGKGNFGPVSMSTRFQVNAEGQPQGSATTLEVAPTPAAKLTATVDTQALVKDMDMPKQIDVAGSGRMGPINYGASLSYTGDGVSATRANVGLKVADPLTVGLESSLAKTPEGMGIKDIGLTTGHQMGALGLNTKVSVDTTTGKTSAGGGLNYKVSPTSSLGLNGESDGTNSKVGFGFTAKF